MRSVEFAVVAVLATLVAAVVAYNKSPSQTPRCVMPTDQSDPLYQWQHDYCTQLTVITQNPPNMNSYDVQEWFNKRRAEAALFADRMAAMRAESPVVPVECIEQ